MPTINKGQDVLTFINVFTVAPDSQEKLVALLVEAAQQTMRHLPGFVSSNVHRSLDGITVVNYAQRKSMADFQAMRRNPEAAAHIEAVAALGTFNATLCEVAETIEAFSEAA